MAKENKVEEQRQEGIEASVSKTEQFFQKNKKSIRITCGVILVVGLIILGYQKLVREPRIVEAMDQMFPAELCFQDGNFETALNGDGNILGFTQIIDEYGAKAGKSVYIYAGICCLQMGDNEQALEYLKKYNGKDPIILARAYALQGDACVNLEQYNKALDFYRKAVAQADNMYAAAYLLKEGQVYEALGRKDEAVECYKEIKDKYPQSFEGYLIQSNIEGAKIAE